MVLSTLIIGLLWIIGAIIISSFPLYIAVKFLGGDATILKVFLTNIIIGVLSIVTIVFLKLSFIFFLLPIIITVVAYMIAFQLPFFKAVFAWVLQYVVAIALIWIAILFLKISIPIASALN